MMTMTMMMMMMMMIIMAGTFVSAQGCYRVPTVQMNESVNIDNRE